MRQRTPLAAGRFVAGVFGFIFAGIGLTVIVFLWAQPFGEFGSPPLVFRVFGSFIALAFITMGGATAFAAIKTPDPTSLLGSIEDRLAQQLKSAAPDEPDRTDSQPGYSCPKCGAPLAGNADVSPHGDVRCGFCKSWFNIHGRTTT